MERSRVQFGFVAFGLAAGLVILFLFDPAQYALYPRCLLHSSTGLFCPSCGALRATHELLHGNLAAAFRFNPLWVLSLPFLIWMAIRFLARKPEPQSPFVVRRPVWICWLLAVVISFGILRNLPFAPLIWLAP
ncbi:MAG: DUF2752 domain-containing protein [Verrucomicrobia bacterium]|nr:DUF2752 domain-containing protein [Verrucomicrobiota bacterium]